MIKKLKERYPFFILLFCLVLIPYILIKLDSTEKNNIRYIQTITCVSENNDWHVLRIHSMNNKLYMALDNKNHLLIHTPEKTKFQISISQNCEIK